MERDVEFVVVRIDVSKEALKMGFGVGREAAKRVRRWVLKKERRDGDLMMIKEMIKRGITLILM